MSLPLFDAPLPPFQGKTSSSRHASYTGALKAQDDRTANIAKLRALWAQPHTLNEIEALSGLPLSSVCSLKACLADSLEVVDFVTIDWGEGKRPTKRTRWKLKASA